MGNVAAPITQDRERCIQWKQAAESTDVFHSKVPPLLHNTETLQNMDAGVQPEFSKHTSLARLKWRHDME